MSEAAELRPECTIFGGPNGAGKSSIYALVDLPGVFINADVIAREINPERPDAAALAAGRQVLHLLDNVLEAREPFCYETTLTSHQSLKVLAEARLRGYRIHLIFVALQNADLHVQRVSDRVLKGGHDIPELIIRRRYDLSFFNLAKAMPLSHSTTIFNNSAASGPRLVLQIVKEIVVRNCLTSGNTFDLRIASIVNECLGIEVRPIDP